MREGHRGDTLDAAVTFRDLVAGGIIELPAGNTGNVGPRPGIPPVVAPEDEPGS